MFLFSLRFRCRTIPISRHLGLDFHTPVELLLGDALFSLGVTLFFDRVEDAAQFREPLEPDG